ncbi:transposase family protein [sulfur-oxidizing endosymbiont of Gigantopelta aegis]|uniref:transposase family protein n=1 Tax=sulfur-oxidizing endosymbiont of Gigantopelta aegis TaxID=2794934 RepID=UPI0018DB02A1|nr:transposase family protein [sulfur-oxidizing endosymbiont of Gigantopelta aegis]
MRATVAKKTLEKHLYSDKPKQQLSTASLLANSLCPWQTPEEEQVARQQLSQNQLNVFRSQLPLILKGFKQIPDHRNPKKIKHKITVLMLYGLLMFVFRFASRREVNREMTRPLFEKNLKEFFPELDTLPHADTLHRVLKKIEIEQFEQLQLNVLNALIRKKKFKRYLINNCYPVAIDGSQKLARKVLFTEELLQRKKSKKKDANNKDKLNEDEDEDEDEEYQYYIYVLEANLSFHNGMVIPLLSEFLEYQLGDQQNSKQDCELRAFRRLCKKIKSYFSHLPILLLLDGLYANGPLMKYCQKKNWQYMIVLQKADLKTVWREFNSLSTIQKNNQYQQEWNGREQYFTWVNQIEYDFDNGKKTMTVHLVVCDEYWQEVNSFGEVEQKHSRHAWLSSRELKMHNVHERCNLGARYRWGIEANFLVEKHQGYHYEHCFSLNWNALKGYHLLMRLAHLFNVLALFSVALGAVDLLCLYFNQPTSVARLNNKPKLMYWHSFFPTYRNV